MKTWRSVILLIVSLQLLVSTVILPLAGVEDIFPLAQWHMFARSFRFSPLVGVRIYSAPEKRLLTPKETMAELGHQQYEKMAELINAVRDGRLSEALKYEDIALRFIPSAPAYRFVFQQADVVECARYDRCGAEETLYEKVLL